MADNAFWKQDKPATEENVIRAGVAGPMGATDAELDRESAATRENIAQVTNPQDRAMLEEHLSDVQRNRARPQPGEAPAGDAWWAKDKPAAQRDLPAGVTASTAGAGRGSVNPQPAGPVEAPAPLGNPMGTGADEILAAAAPSSAAPAPQGPPQREVGFVESAGRGWGRAGASTAKTMSLAVAAPVVVAQKLKNLFTGSDDTGMQDAVFRRFVDPNDNAVNWYALKPEEKQGFLGKVGEAVGSWRRTCRR
jgi:hypothetical protein